MSNALAYAELWALIKKGSTVKITVSKYNIPSIKRMISKHKDEDREYKLLNPYRARLIYKILATNGELQTMEVKLKQHATAPSTILS